jgi:hypothetical protein
MHHPVVGELHLTFEALALPADPGLSLVVYGAEPGSPSEDGLRLLGSWAATLVQTETASASRSPASDTELQHEEGATPPSPCWCQAANCKSKAT